MIKVYSIEEGCVVELGEVEKSVINDREEFLDFIRKSEEQFLDQEEIMERHSRLDGATIVDLDSDLDAEWRKECEWDDYGNEEVDEAIKAEGSDEDDKIMKKALGGKDVIWDDVDGSPGWNRVRYIFVRA